jgi:hypothetical protein
MRISKMMIFHKLLAMLAGFYNRHSGMIKTVVAVILITAAVSGMFAYSASIRKPWLGTLYSPYHINPTAYTLHFAQNWYSEGAIKLKFASVEDVRSVETESKGSPRLYVSWPPGNLIPIHVASLVTGKPPTAEGIMKFNLFNHLISALLLALGVFYLLLQTGARRITAGLLAITPAIIFLFTTATLWFMQVVYHGPQAVIPLFVLYLFLEILRRDIQKLNFLRIVNILQFLVVFAGVLTDYLFYFVVLVAFIIRLVNKEISAKPKNFIRQSLAYWSPVVLGSLVFLGQLFWLNTLPQLISRALFRTGSAGGVDFFVTRFWNNHLIIGFGQTGRVLILVSIALLAVLLAGEAINRIRKRNPADPVVNRVLSLASLALVPPILQVLVLKNWCANHLFTSLMFAIPLALIPLVLFPTLIYLYLRRSSRASERENNLPHRFPVIAAIVLLALAVGYATAEKMRMGILFKPQSTAAASAQHESLYRFVGEHTGYADVVFSPFMEARHKNKIPLILAGNNIYQLFSPHDIFYTVRHIRSKFNVCFVIDRRYEIPSWLRPLTGGSATAENEELSLYRIDGREFLERYERELPADKANAYFRQRQEYERLRNKLDADLSRHDFEGALVTLQGILVFLEKHNAIAANSRYLISEMAILNILNRREEADIRLERLRRLTIFPERHLIWGWNPDPHTLNVMRRDPTARKIMINGIDSSKKH